MFYHFFSKELKEPDFLKLKKIEKYILFRDTHTHSDHNQIETIKKKGGI